MWVCPCVQENLHCKIWFVTQRSNNIYTYCIHTALALLFFGYQDLPAVKDYSDSFTRMNRINTSTHTFLTRSSSSFSFFGHPLSPYVTSDNQQYVSNWLVGLSSQHRSHLISCTVQCICLASSWTMSQSVNQTDSLSQRQPFCHTWKTVSCVTFTGKALLLSLSVVRYCIGYIKT